MPPACTLLCKLFPCHALLSGPPRAQITFNSPVVSVGFFFVLDVFSILTTTTTKSLQLYHFLQAVVRPCKAASGVEMVHRQCQQGEEGAARERLGRSTWTAASTFQSSRGEKVLWSVAGWCLLLYQLLLVLLAGPSFQWLNHLLSDLLISLHLCSCATICSASLTSSHCSTL